MASEILVVDLQRRRQVASIPVPGALFTWIAQIATTSAGRILVVDAATVIEVDPRTGTHRTVAVNAYWLTPTRDDLDLNWVRSSEVSAHGIIPLDQLDRLLGEDNLVYDRGDLVADQSGFDGRANVSQSRALLRDGHTLVLTRPNLLLIDVAKIVPFRDRFPA